MNTQKRVFNKLAEETKVELSAQKIELGIFDDIEKLKNKALSASKRAEKSVLSALSDFADSTSALEQAIKITEDGKQKAKELGVNELIKRADLIKSQFESVLKKHRNNISDLRSVRGNI
jgi:hypothetical protein